MGKSLGKKCNFEEVCFEPGTEDWQRRSHTRATLITIAPRSQILFERVEIVLNA